MASGRRGGPPDLKSTLGSLLRTTLDQASAVRDVVEQQTRSKRGLFDQALAQRKRTAALAQLGEEVFKLAKRGEIGELLLEPQIGMLIGELEQLDMNVDHGSPEASDPDAISSAEYAARFRNQRGGEPANQGDDRVWRPVMPDDTEIVDTVASEDETAADEPQLKERGRPSRMPRRSAVRRGGGIHFAPTGPRTDDLESDEDLASYMHDDDVPS